MPVTLVVRKLVKETPMLIDGVMGIHALYVLVGTQGLPKYVTAWFVRYAKGEGTFRVWQDATTVDDYVVENPDGASVRLKRPGRRTRSEQFIKTYLKEHE